MLLQYRERRFQGTDSRRNANGNVQDMSSGKAAAAQSPALLPGFSLATVYEPPTARVGGNCLAMEK
jgi:hypothetical protein